MTKKSSSLIFLLLFTSLILCISLWFEKKAEYQMNLNLNNRNNSWDRYGSKSTRKKICSIEYNHLQLNLKSSNVTKDEIAQITVNLNNLQSEINRYSKELEQILDEANTYDKQFNIAERRGEIFSIGMLLSLFSFLLLFGEGLFLTQSTMLKAISFLSIFSSLGLIVYGFIGI